MYIIIHGDEDVTLYGKQKLAGGGGKNTKMLRFTCLKLSYGKEYIRLLNFKLCLNSVRPLQSLCVDEISLALMFRKYKSSILKTYILQNVSCVPRKLASIISTRCDELFSSDTTCIQLLKHSLPFHESELCIEYQRNPATLNIIQRFSSDKM